MPKFSNDSIHGHDYYDEQIGAFKVPLYLSAIFEHPDRRTPRPRLRCLNRLPNTHHAHESQRANQRRVWLLSRGERRRPDCGRGCPSREWGWVPSWGPRLRLLLLNSTSLAPESHGDEVISASPSSSRIRLTYLVVLTQPQGGRSPIRSMTSATS